MIHLPLPLPLDVSCGHATFSSRLCPASSYPSVRACLRRLRLQKRLDAFEVMNCDVYTQHISRYTQVCAHVRPFVCTYTNVPTATSR
jgi:hypothetical protein